MTTYGYAHTSTVEQVAGLADQISKLKVAGCTDQSIYQEQVSSVRMEDQVEFAKVLFVLRAGDVLVFSSLSHAARSMVHMVEVEAKVARWSQVQFNDCVGESIARSLRGRTISPKFSAFSGVPYPFPMARSSILTRSERSKFFASGSFFSAAQTPRVRMTLLAILF